MQLDKLTDSVKLNLILKTKDACPMFWMKIYKKVACGGKGKSLLKMAGEKSFWGGIENFRFCLGEELTLDDTMHYNMRPSSIF